MNPKESLLKSHSKDGDVLTVIENITSFKRLFFIDVKEAKYRGDHAHYKCTQYMFSIKGNIELQVTNSIDSFNFNLIPGKNVVEVPPLWWAKQKYSNDCILGVLCDMNYDADDYIRDWNYYSDLIKDEKN